MKLIARMELLAYNKQTNAVFFFIILIRFFYCISDKSETKCYVLWKGCSIGKEIIGFWLKEIVVGVGDIDKSDIIVLNSMVFGKMKG